MRSRRGVELVDRVVSACFAGTGFLFLEADILLLLGLIPLNDRLQFAGKLEGISSDAFPASFDSCLFRGSSRAASSCA